MIHRAHSLSSTTEAFNEEYNRLRGIFIRLQYPMALINSTINNFVRDISLGADLKRVKDGSVVRIKSNQMKDLSHKIGSIVEPIFVSKKLEQDLKPKEIKRPIVNQQCVVYSFLCDLCDADYSGYTARHLHRRIVEHKNPPIGKHLVEPHRQLGNPKESQFRILRKCQTKFECLIYEMLFIKEINPSLNTQTNTIRAKLFV